MFLGAPNTPLHSSIYSVPLFRKTYIFSFLVFWKVGETNCLNCKGKKIAAAQEWSYNRVFPLPYVQREGLPSNQFRKLKDQGHQWGREVQILDETNTESLSIPGNLENWELGYPTTSHSQYTGGGLEREPWMGRLPLPAPPHPAQIWGTRLMDTKYEISGFSWNPKTWCQLNAFLYPVLKVHFGGTGMVIGKK